ncbi:putative Nitrosoguanidine resistance protein SNG1 [Glonium stellatum]|uniref:Putative Nitrosoguanidine resistance protein SNG1 n=1 Tax=Glonium stellatum TaxID=574774 RepID=A0A8E2F977_9PEZI|nr:putative Nitrosoguanidine resistance protein SNG1 [Glonium stellatum]
MSQKNTHNIFETLQIWRLYPKAHENRLPVNHPTLRGPRHAFFKAAGRNFALLQILFLGLFAYIFGSLFQQDSHIHNLNVLFVDYDGGIIGTTVRNAYRSLQGNSFPTLIERAGSDFPTPDDLQHEVCDARYWAALYISSGASNKVQAVAAGQSTNYNKNDIISYIWNEARYSAVIDSAISTNLQTLSSVARVEYANRNWTDTIQTPSTASFSVFAEPWNLNSVNIQPTMQGSRLIYNTLVIILILIQEFFYLGTINTLYEAFKIYSRLCPHRIIIFRNVVSVAYCLLGSLSTAGAIWAFRAGWNVNGNQFALTWAILWLFAHVNFLTLDVFSIWLPPPYVPMALITWVVFNVTSILLPFALSPAFYRWAYVMPAHEVYQVLLDIWSGGCNPQLRYALPILFALELSGLFLSGLGVYRRCHYAVIREEAEKEAFQMRLDTALAFEQRKRAEDKQKIGRTSSEIKEADEPQEEAELEKDREELASAIELDNTKLQRERTKASTSMGFGPAFGFQFGTEDGS